MRRRLVRPVRPDHKGGPKQGLSSVATTQANGDMAASADKGKSAGTGAGAEMAGLPFEAALAELEGIVSKLELGQVPLEESIAIYERGEALKRHCEALLKRAEARVESITLGPGGEPTGLEPLDGA